MGFIEKLRTAIFGEKVDYNELINNGAIIVDVRSPSEFNSGHVQGSENYPLQTLSSNVEKLKDKTVVLVCKSGIRAQSAKSILTKNNIKAYNAGAWQNIKK